jgi:hypothetical protein
MVEKHIIELINKDIDGELDPEEKTRFLQLIQNNQEANDLYQELSALSHDLDNQSQIKPPRELKQNILKKIDPDLYKKSQKKTNDYKGQRIFALPGVRTILSYAAMLIIGFSIAFLLMFPSKNSDQSDMYKVLGTIGMKEFPAVQSIPIDLNNLRGKVMLKEADSYVWLEFDFDTRSTFDTKIIYETAAMKFLIIRPYNPENMKLSLSGNKIDIITDRRFVLTFEKISEKQSLFILTFQVDNFSPKSFEITTSQLSE